jgi:hypothetical protein
MTSFGMLMNSPDSEFQGISQQKRHMLTQSSFPPPKKNPPELCA